MKNICMVMILMCTCLLLACSNQTTQNLSTPSAPLVLQIKPDNTKLFTYTALDLSEQQRNSMPAYWKKEVNRGTKSLDETRKRRNPNIVIERKKELILSQLDTKLTASEFCRDGYAIINSHFELEHSSIKGRCNESATTADRVKFPSAISTTTTEFDSLNEGLLDTPK